MKKLFFDPVANMYLKILPNEDKLQRELVGAHVFKDFIDVGLIEKLDKCTLGSVAVDGEVSTAISSQELTSKLVELWQKVRESFDGIVLERHSIDQLISNLLATFEAFPEIVAFLERTKVVLQEVPYIPLHGDLQKQNILINKTGELVLIDFEHFCFGPLEFEFANSFFHDDANCLDMDRLVPSLLMKRQITLKLLQSMIVLYGLKELKQGKPTKVVQEGITRGQQKLIDITGRKRSIIELDFSKSKKSSTQLSSCFL